MDSPYTPPSQSSPVEVAFLVKRKKLWKYGIIVGVALMTVVPLIGLTGTLIGMTGASPKPAGPDVAALADHIGEVLVSTIIGVGFGLLVGLPVLLISLLKFLSINNSLKQLEKA